MICGYNGLEGSTSSETGLLIPRSSRVIYVGRSNTCGSKRIILYDAFEGAWAGELSWHAAATARKFHERSLKSCKSVSRSDPAPFVYRRLRARHDSVTPVRENSFAVPETTGNRDRGRPAITVARTLGYANVLIANCIPRIS